MKKLLLLAAFGLMASPAFAQGNSASTSSTGDTNFAKVEQDGATNIGSIDQDGNTNEAFIRQLGDTNTGSVIQQGNLNDALSETAPGLDIGGDLNDTHIEQWGDQNIARIQASDLTAFGGNDNAATDNDISIFQGTSSDAANSNRAEISVRGDNNDGDAVQQGDGNTLLANGSRAVSGFDGRAYMTATNNTFDFDQIGDDNDAVVWFAGDDNDITISQDGNMNTVGTPGDFLSGVNVYGDMNTVDISQTGDGNMADVAIDGSNNTSTITQN